MPSRNAAPAMRNGPQTRYQLSSAVLREYQMNNTEKTSASTATVRSRASRGVCTGRLSRSRHLICASAENPYGIAAVTPVIRTNVVKTVAPLAPMKLTVMATEASTVEAMMPTAGTARRESLPKLAGKSPSRAAANGISAQIMVQPFSAPSPEMTTAIAMRSPAQVPPPAIALAAAEYDALLDSSA